MAANEGRTGSNRRRPATKSRPASPQEDRPRVEEPPLVIEASDVPPVVETTGPSLPDEGDPRKEIAASQQDLEKLRRVHRRRVIKASILALIGVLFIIFVIQNDHPVEVRLVFGTASIRLIWVIVASVLFGAVAGFLIGRPDKNLRLHGPRRRKDDASA